MDQIPVSDLRNASFGNKDNSQNKIEYSNDHLESSKNQMRMNSSKHIVCEEELHAILHEIRNPLTAISMANEALLLASQNSNGDRSAELYTAIISRNTQKILDILKSLLSGDGQDKPVSEMINIGDVIDQSLSAVADRLYLKDIKLLKSFYPGLIIKGNPGKLTRAFLNLLVNSIEAIKDPGGKVWITTYRTSSDVIVEFKDNGIGMDEHLGARMFDEHFSGKSEGLGIGLAQVKSILQEHHAHLSVYSSPGVGTSFVMAFKLPVAEAVTRRQ